MNPTEAIKLTGLDAMIERIKTGQREPCLGGCGQMVLSSPMILPVCKSCTLRDGEMDQTDRREIKDGRLTYQRWSEIQTARSRPSLSDYLANDVPAIPEAYRGAIPDDRTRGWFLSSNCLLVIAGPTGTGKTWQACGVMRMAAKRYGPNGVAMVKASEVARFNQQAVEIAKRTAFIVLDDLATRITPGAMATALEIIDARLDHKRRTIVTTNAGFADLAAIDPRLASRLASGVPYKLEGADRRMPRRTA